MRRENFAVTGIAAGVAVALIAQVAFVQSACADMITIESNIGASTEGQGQFTGSIEYAFDEMSMKGLLTVSLTNTTDAAPLSSLITGFVFNIASADPNRSSLLIATDHDQFVNLNNESAVPFGKNFHGGAALGGMWLGGSNPNAGIAPGETGLFTFEITAFDASNLSASSFLDGPFDHNFIVRFRGIDFADKVPAIPIVPAPAALAAFAVAGLFSRRRRR